MKQAFVIGIAGGTGSGKTTLAKKLKEDFQEDVILMSQDFYYCSNEALDYEERKKINFDHPNAFDTQLMVKDIKELKKMKAITRPVYSFVDHRRLQEKVLEEPKKVILIEGILIFENKELRDLMDVKVFVDTDSDIRLTRRLVRDIHDRGRSIDAVINQYLNTVKPMHEAFVEPTKRQADIIIPEGGLNQVACSMLVERIKAILNS